MALKTYRELDAWRKSMGPVEPVCMLTRTFPNDEKFGLTSQVRRAAVSVPATVAEGYGRSHRGDCLHHLSVAKGSLMELETPLTIAVRLKYTTRREAVPVWDPTQDAGGILKKLINSPQKSPIRHRKPAATD